MEVAIVILLAALLAAVVMAWVQASGRIRALENRVSDSQANLLQGTTQQFGEIQKNLGELSRTSQHMERVGREISSLNDLLRSPHLRGSIGELLLGDLLSQILTPDQYSLQHRFRSGERVDAVIKLKAGMVPVDSKFPLDSFRQFIVEKDDKERKRLRRQFVRATKRHIDDIARKYILPDEGTFDFALMYIPAENVYYETIIRDEALGEEKSLLSYALAKRVIPVSPNSFYAYLQAIALGLKGLQVEEQAQEIMRYLSRLQGDFGRFAADYRTLGGHLERARNKYEEAERRLARFGDRLDSAGESPEMPKAGQEVEPGDVDG